MSVSPPARGVEVVARPAHLPQRDELGEGPFWDVQTQALWWVDIIGRRVHRLDGDGDGGGGGEVRAWTLPQPVSAAVPCASGGLMVAMVDGLHRMNLGSGLTTPFAAPDPHPANRSNECRADPQGRLWLGTMANNIGPDGQGVPLSGSTGGLFRVDSDGSSIRLLEGVGISNTLAWSPDGATLYFADSLLGVIWAFAFDTADGRISDRRVLVEPGAAPGGPDGSSVDEEGFLWNARWGGGCVARFAPDGRLDRTIAVPALQPTSTAFGGADGRTLFVTSARQGLTDADPESLDGALFRLQVDVAGLPLARFAG